MIYPERRRAAALKAVGALMLTVLLGTRAMAQEQPAPPEPKAKAVGLSAEAKMTALMDPKSPEMVKKAPDLFKVRFETSKGNFVVEAHREWSPQGVDRFYNLVRLGYYDDARFFRVIKGFMAQFGISRDPKLNKTLMNAGIPDEPTKMGNTRGRVTFAKRGSPNSRTTQLFINFGNNSALDSQGFAAFGEVVEGLEIVDSLNGEYGEGAPKGRGPDQQRIQNEGNAYLKASFPNLDFIKKATIVE